MLDKKIEKSGNWIATVDFIVNLSG